VRSILALLICVLAGLCIHTSIATERAGLIFQGFHLEPAPPELSGFVWQHPRLLLAFAVAVALAALVCLRILQSQRRAVLVAGFVAVALVVQLRVVTPVLHDSMMRMLHGVAKEVSR
jgi:hypothetical protein